MPEANSHLDPPGRSAECLAAQVTVVVVHRNQPDSVADTVAAFLAQPATSKVIVIDNGSEPAIKARLTDLVTPAEVIFTEANLGFGPGANVGIRRWLRSGVGEWVAVTPHDSQPSPDVLERILAAVSDRPDVGLVSADVGDGCRPIIDPFLGPIDSPPGVESGFDDSDYPHGTLMLARRGCVSEVGLFDERYFAYCEEADLGLRATAAGWKCGVARGAMIANPGMTSSIELVAYLQLRNTLMMLRDHFGRWNVTFRTLLALAQLPIGLVHKPARGLHWSPTGRLKGIRDHVLRRYGPPPGDVG